jgi:hypothetical protein
MTILKAKQKHTLLEMQCSKKAAKLGHVMAINSYGDGLRDGLL